MKKARLGVLAIMVTGCVQSFEPKVLNSASNLLVVDGFINGKGVSTIKLRRSIKLGDQGTYPAETGAQLTIESQLGSAYPLQESAEGTYTSPAQNLVQGSNYRLRIHTRDGHDYASDFTALKITPKLDQFEGRIQANGVQLFLSTHDESGQSQYYRWDYTETWEFTSIYESYYRYAGNNKVVLRGEDIYHCWRTEPSTNIVTTSTVRLSQDAVRDFRLLYLAGSSERLRYKYSIMLRQYALSQAEFDYWEAVKKNTENIGTLFDPLPSQVQGNVHCLSAPDEPVLGFVGATSVVEQRLFIDRFKLPPEWQFKETLYPHCLLGLDEFPAPRYKGMTYDDFFRDSVFRTPVSRKEGAYTAQVIECVDCRIRGTNVKPSFWPW